MIQVWFDGTMWAARKLGFPGKVFADSAAEAVRRVRGWSWTHPRNEGRRKR